MKNISLLLFIVIALFLAQTATFTVQEHEQAIVVQLGKVQGDPITEAGLHFKVPFFHDIKYFDKRILQWDGQRGEVPTKDKKFIWVDTTARWKISNALVFYKSVRDIRTALLRIGPILDGATKDTVSNYNLIESVRNSNKILSDISEHAEEAKKLTAATDTNSLEEIMTDVEEVKFGREKLSEMIAERARAELDQLGISLIDVQLRSIAYQESVEKKVFQSMISERNQIAAKIRSSGKGEAAKIHGQRDLALKRIESEAYRKAQVIKGEAEAKSIAIFAKSLKRDPEFFEFIKTLDAYKTTIAKKGEFILSTDNAFLSLLKNGG